MSTRARRPASASASVRRAPISDTLGLGHRGPAPSGGGPDREDGVGADLRAEGAAGAGRGDGQPDRVVAEDVDAAPVQGEDALGTCGDAQLAALAVVLGDDERSPRPGRPGSHGNWTYRHPLFAFGCGARRRTSRGPCGPGQSRARDLLALASRGTGRRARAERPVGARDKYDRRYPMESPQAGDASAGRPASSVAP